MTAIPTATYVGVARSQGHRALFLALRPATAPFRRSRARRRELLTRARGHFTSAARAALGDRR